MTKLYDCDICGFYHPWDWDGDCRDDMNRFSTPEEFAYMRAIPFEEVEVMDMADRVEADISPYKYGSVIPESKLTKGEI